ncbi:polysaccharide pyruvyl transferase family protein [Agrobacterium sp. RAC06]|uniref:polysaccharide pyruvyl transferase family protein n=1 Tax=Agrobacterium sp. RAC06 TaxID=1842536 RepID=UPI00083D7002|nr:polysaccharide pyruvyl transferase family protein [Agrobacterium sp. RAC06]AOG12573.1 polysaccharide pyruvyl transferase family protein [Agrobacterium sp. RAC06]
MLSKDRSKSVVCYIYLKTNFLNVGDALINKELLKILTEFSDVVVDVSGAPTAFVDSLSINELPNVAVRRMGPFRLYMSMVRDKMLGKRVVYVLMPGGNRGEKSFALYLLNVLYNGYLAIMRISGVRLVQFGVSFEHLGPRYVKILRGRSKFIDAIFVRDQMSLQYATKLGIKIAGLMPDLAFNLNFDRLGFASRTDVVPTPARIALSFRTDGKHASEEEVTLFVHAVKKRYPKNPLRFVSQVKSDARFMRQLADRFGADGDGDVDFMEIVNDPYDFRTVYADCSIIFSNRLHALLMAMASGCIPFAVLNDESGEKVRGVFQEIRLEGNVLCVSDELSMIDMRESIPQESVKIVEASKQMLRSVISLAVLRS